MVRAPFEVSGEDGSFRVLVRAASMQRAEEDLRSRYPGGEVRLIFPLDGDDFFTEAGADEEIETEYLVLEEGPAAGEPSRGDR